MARDLFAEIGGNQSQPRDLFAEIGPKKEPPKPADSSSGSLIDALQAGLRLAPSGIGLGMGLTGWLDKRAASGEAEADAAKDEGFFDRTGSLLERGTQSGRRGIVDTVAGVTGKKSAQEYSQTLGRSANMDIAGDTSWEDVKADPSLGNIGSFVLNRGIESAPLMAAAAVPGVGMPIVAASGTGNIARSRADADGREDVTGKDVAIAAPFGIGSAMLERFGIDKIIGANASRAIARVGQAAAAEGITETLQSGLEYTGGSVGTQRGFRLNELIDQSVAGGVAGAGMGGGIRTGIEVGSLPFRPVAPGKLEQSGAELSPDDVASPLDTDAIARGKQIITGQTAGKAVNEILLRNGMPRNGSRVSVTLPNGKVKIGTVTDAFDEVVEGEAATGVVIGFDDGTSMREHFDTLADAGVVVKGLSPTEEADAIDAQMRELATQPVNVPAAPAPQVDGAVAAPATPSALVAPVAGKITSGFGQRKAPKKGASTSHGGIDYAVPVGTSVGSAGNGKVVAVGWDKKGGGNFVKIDHGNGVVTSYAHLKGATVKVGDEVTAGQQIALSGNTGNSTGPHLHFTVRVKGKAVDPLSVLGKELVGAAPAPVAQAVSPTEAVMNPDRIEFDKGTTNLVNMDPAAPIERGQPIPVRAEAQTDTAVTANGRELPVRYGVVELADLKASNDLDGRANPNYPQALQPRDRNRGISQAQIAGIAGNLNPRLIGRSPKASDGAPIIGPDGVVESGNGRTLALQQAYLMGGDRIEAYKQMLADEGFDTTGMQQPVLVRVREGEMSDADVLAFTREANARDTLDMSATEQAMADANALGGGMLELYRGGDIDGGNNREFVRRFLGGVVASPNDFAKLIDSEGRMSQAAVARVRGAMLAKAYGNQQLVEQAIESTDTEVKSIISALTDVAGTWSKLREGVADGTVQADLDITENVNEAVGIVDRARREGKRVADLVNQRDIFSGKTVSPTTEAVLRLFFARPDFTRAVSRVRLAEALNFYAEEAMKAAPGGASLFGDLPKVEASGVLDLARVRQGNDEIDGRDLFAETGQPEAAEQRPAEPARQDAPEAGPDVGGRSGTVLPQDGGSEAQRDVSRAATDTTRPSPRRFIPDAQDILAVVDANNQVRNAKTPYQEREAFRQGAAVKLGLAGVEDEKSQAAESDHNEQYRAGMAAAEKELRRRTSAESSDRQSEIEQHRAAPKVEPGQEAPPYEPAAAGQPVSLFAPVDEDVVPLTMSVEDFAEITDEWAALFADPGKDEIVRLADKVKAEGYLTPAQAAARIDDWEKRAQEQFDDPDIRMRNSSKTVLSLFDLSGEWSRPWEEAGYNVIRFDIQNDPELGDVNNFNVEFFTENYDISDVYAILAACPCTDFASSGARHFAAKDADGRTEASKELVFQTLRTIEYFRPAVWAIENPVGRIERLTGLPKARLTFDPNHLGDPYTKKTMLWGKFNADLPVAGVEPTEGSKMWKQYGGKSLATKNARSVTPRGFSNAFFVANNFEDMPIERRMEAQYPEASGAVKAALKAGVTPERIDELMEDTYGNYEYEDARNALAAEVASMQPTPPNGGGQGTTSDIDAAVAEVDTDPTDAQKEAGNYRKAHITVQGLDITIENPKGSERSGKDPNGKSWSVKMPAHYGYVKRSKGADGEQVDVYVGDQPEARSVFIIDQKHADTGKFDEHKVMLGFPDMETAEDTYRDGFSDGKGGQRLGGITEMSIDEFKSWLEEEQTKPVADDAGPSAATNPAELRALLEKSDTAETSKHKLELKDNGDNGWSVKVSRKGEGYGVTRGGTMLGAWTRGKAINEAVKEAFPFVDEEAAAPKPRGGGSVDLVYYGAGGKTETRNLVPGAGKVDMTLGGKDDDVYTAADVSPLTQGQIDTIKRVEGDTTRQMEILDAIDRGLIRDGDMIAMGSPRWALESGFADIGPVDGTRRGRITEAGKKKLAELRGEKTPKPSPNKIVTDERAAELRARLKEKLNPNRVNSGIDPEILAIGTELAVYHIEKGARRFVAFAKAVAADLDMPVDALRKYLRGWYNGARDMMEDMGESVVSMDSADEVADAMRKFADWSTTPAETATAQPRNDDGLQNPIPQGDARTSAADVQGAAPEGRAGSTPEPENQAGTQPVRSTDGRSGKAAERTGARSERAADGGSPGLFDDAGLPDLFAGQPRPESPAPAAITGQNWFIEPGSLAESRGPAQKAADNVRAIEIVKELDAQGRKATAEEQAAISRYVGWGGLKNAFPDASGEYGKGFETIGPRLRELLTDDEYETARRSIQYAHYTSETIVRSMWDLAKQLGFKGGKIFEPGMGTGNFAGMMPRDVAASSSYHGLEYDKLTARIAYHLYPKWAVQQDDYTRTPQIKDAYDLVIGNPPFSETVIQSDPAYAGKGFVLHDYFFAKSLDAVRPGGLLMFVTSAGTMNKLKTSAREYMADMADLVGAIRLPGNAFAENAGTQVTTDIVVLRKRLPGEQPGSRDWVETDRDVMLPNRAGEMVPAAVNRYFQANPEMVLGEQGMFDKLVSGDRYAVRAPKGYDLAKNLQLAVSRFPAAIMSQPATVEDKAKQDFDVTATERKEGSFYIGADKRLMQMRGGVGVPVEKQGKGVTGGISAAAQERIKALIPVRDALRDVYRHDLAGDNAKASAARAQLNLWYDAFVKKFGPINKAEISYRRPSIVQLESARMEAREEARLAGREWDDGSFDVTPYIEAKAKITEIARARADAKADAIAAGREWNEGTFDPDDVPDLVIDKRPNIDPFMDDQESYRLRAIEHYNDDTGEAKKSNVFFENVITKEMAPEIRSANDALLYVMNRVGRPDIDEIARLAGKSKAEAIEELGDAVFLNHDGSGQYQTREQYLSGNVREKLALARKAAEADPAFERNVAALEIVQPMPLGPADIATNLGMPWIPADVIVDFAKDALGLSSFNAKYNARLAAWSVNGDVNSAQARTVWGTSDREAPFLIADALNRQQPKIYKEVRGPNGEKQRVLNPEATQAAQDKVNEIKAKFAEWIWTDQARTDRLVKLYNEQYNSLVAPEYDGSYLTTPGIASTWSWRPHQTRVVARIIQSGNTYMAHAVGAGKTSAMIGAGMEMRRLGLVRKPMYVVPNHMLGQFTKEFYEQYPTARIAVADERRFHTSRRKQFVANVAADDLDAVIITHSAFGYIPISEEFSDKLIQEQIDEYRDILGEIGKAQEDRFTRRRVEQQIEALEQRLSGRSNRKTDQVITFEEMGVDFLFVDEAHLFRKLDFSTKMGNVKGIDPAGSKMSFDLFSKVRYLESRSKGRSTVLASGTPITNTMAELFSLSRYLQLDELEKRQLSQFDAWASAFGDTSTALEQDPAGGYKSITRFAKFVNVPELSVMVRQVMDVVTPNDLEKYVTRPQLKGGKRQMVVVEQTDGQADYQEVLKGRMEAIQKRSGPPKKGDDILLSVIGDGRKSAIDYRLIDASAPKEQSKLETMIDSAFEIWKRTKRAPFHAITADGFSAEPVDFGPATQMIFSDFGINGDFPVHKYIAAELARRGVPKNEIAIISDFKSHVARQRLFNDMNDGKVRFLIGSVAKMGTGVNAQKRLYALHNMDPQWYPANDEQRNGRIIRQGNMNPEVEIRDYSTKGTYDSQMWQLMETKARFIEGFMRGDPTLRDMDDLGEASQYEQAKAMTTSDPRIMRLTELKQDLEKAMRRRSAFDREITAIRNTIDQAKFTIDRQTQRVSQIEADIAQRQDISGDAFTGKVGGKEFDKRVEFGEAVLAKLDDIASEKSNATESKTFRVGEVGGFQLLGDAIFGDGAITARLFLQRNGELLTQITAIESASGLVSSIASKLRGFDDDLKSARGKIENARATIEQFTPQLDRTFTGDAEIRELQDSVNKLEAELEKESKPVTAEVGALEGRDAAEFINSLERPEEYPGLKESRVEPIAVLSGEEMGKLPKNEALRIKIMRDRALNWYRKNLAGKSAVGADGVEVVFGSAGMKKSTSHKGEHLLAALPALRSIIEKGAIRELPERRSEMKAFLYAGTVRLGGEDMRLAAIVRQDANGRRHYDLTKDTGKKSVGSPAGAVGAVASGPEMEVSSDAEINLFADEPVGNATEGKIFDELRARMAELGIQDAIALRVSDSMGARVAGNFDPVRRLITIALGSSQPRDISLNHEAVHAMRELGLFRDAEWQTLAKRAKSDYQLMRSVKRRYAELNEEAQTEEAVADMFAAWVRQKNQKGMAAKAFERVRDFFEALRNWARGNGWQSAGDVMRAMDAGAIGKREAAERGGSVSDSREDVTQTAAFKRWFGDSKVVDNDGNPLVVFHGTEAQVTKFDRRKAGTATGDPNAVLGTFFSTSRSEASSYGQSNTISAYLSIKNPVELSMDELVGMGDDVQDFRELRAEFIADGYDGIFAPYDDGEGGWWIAFNSNQIKSATANNGEFDPSNPDIRFSKVDTMLSALSNSSPFKGKAADMFDRWRAASQDRYLPLLRTQQAIEKQLGRPLREGENPYLGEELMSGRIGAKLETLFDDMVDPLFEAMHKEGVDLDELETYLYARHAQERNERIASINPDFEEGTGSGMSDLEAQAILNRVDRSGRKEALDRVAALVDRIRDRSLRMRVDAGLMSEDDMKQWKSIYKHYVPLRGRIEVDGDADRMVERISRSGGGINVKGKESRRAFGRRSKADNILAYTLLQAEEAIVRSETNRVAQKFYVLAKNNPDPNFWATEKVTRKPMIDRDTGLVRYEDQTRLQPEDRDWTVTAKFDGEERRVTMNKDNAAARRLADAMRNLTQHQTDLFVHYLGIVNRFLSAVNTSYNPEFVVTNAFRDIQTAAVNLAGFDRDKLVASTLRDYKSALVASVKGAFKNESGEWGKWYREFVNEGGRVYFNQIDDLDTLKKRIEVSAKAASGGNRLSVKTMFFKVRDFVEASNNGVENAIRLAAYKNAREAGMSKAQAASLAKNLTVNFNRRGTFGPAMNAAYLFFNASVQGSARIITAMGSKRVRKIMAGVVVSGAMIELLNAMLSGDDDDGESYYDKISDFDKSRNLIIMLPGEGGRHIKIPLPYGYNAFFAIGRTAAEIMRRGGDRAMESASNLGTTIVDAFNPVGGSESLLNFISPTVIDPIVDLERNRDYSDRPILPEQNPYEPESPDAQRYFSSVGAHWRTITDFLTSATGGDDVVAGAIDVSPETLEHLAGVVIGAAGSFFDRNVSLVTKAFDSDEEVEANDLPFIRKMVGQKPGWYDKSAYYDRVNQIEKAISDAKDYAEREDWEKFDRYVDDKAKLIELEEPMKAAQKEMRAIRKARGENEFAYEMGKIDEATYKEERRVYKDAEKLVVSEFNTQWNAVMLAGQGE